MIDSHCHLEQSDYEQDRDVVIQRCRQQLRAIITSCADPRDFDVSMQLVRRYGGFVFATASVHPGYVKEFSEGEVNEYIKRIKSNRDSLVAIGETGLDYDWVKEVEWREKQRELFVQLISLAELLQLPLVIHSRGAAEEVGEVLEEYGVERVQMHMFTTRSLLKQVIDNGWLISVNTLLLVSKGVRKIVRDCPIEQLMLETDAPWLGIGKDGKIKPKDEVRNEPTAVMLVARKVAEIKKMDIQEVDEQTTENAKRFFELNI